MPPSSGRVSAIDFFGEASLNAHSRDPPLRWILGSRWTGRSTAAMQVVRERSPGFLTDGCDLCKGCGQGTDNLYRRAGSAEPRPCLAIAQRVYVSGAVIRRGSDLRKMTCRDRSPEPRPFSRARENWRSPASSKLPLQAVHLPRRRGATSRAGGTQRRSHST